MRTLTIGAENALNSRAVGMVMLVEMQLTQTLYLATGTRRVVYAGNTYLPTGTLGGVEEIDDSTGEFKSLKFMLSGVPPQMLAIALEEDIRNKPVYVRIAVLDAQTNALLDVPLVWSGSLDQMPITQGRTSSNISATGQHRGATFARVKPLRYTDTDQQRLFPGDTSAKYVTSQANHPDIWPAASFGRQ